MKNNFEKEFTQLMNGDKEIPVNVRKTLDQTYDIIRAQSEKKKVNFIWKKVVAVACALIITGVVLTNEQIMASINEFFNFGDKGIEEAVHNGYIQENNSEATNRGIKITLDNYLSDANKMSISFQLEFENPSFLKNANDVSMDYRIKNGDGDYIEEFIQDTKTLKGENRYVSGLEYHVPILDAETGIVQFDVLMESHQGSIPALKDAVVEVESVHIFYGADKMKEIDGNWELPMTNNEKSNITVQYEMLDSGSNIQVSEANANPTSLHVTFSVDGIYEDENTFAHRMKIIDEEGNEYHAKDFGISKKNGKTVISTNFPITSYNDSQNLKLIVEELGEVEIVKK